MATLVIIESPYAGNVEKNVAYAKQCVVDSLRRGESPFASHLLYTQDGILNDDDPEQRAKGIDAGLDWAKRADLTAVYTDLGISRGMQKGIENARQEGRTIEFRTLEVYHD